LAGRLLAGRRDPAAPELAASGAIPAAVQPNRLPPAFQLPPSPRTEQADVVASPDAQTPDAGVAPYPVDFPSGGDLDGDEEGPDGGPPGPSEWPIELPDEPWPDPEDTPGGHGLPKVRDTDGEAAPVMLAEPVLAGQPAMAGAAAVQTARPGQAVPLTPRRPMFHPSTPAGRPQREKPASGLRAWLVPATIALFLVAIIVLGLMALARSDDGEPVGVGMAGVPQGPIHGIISLENQAPWGALAKGS
jgi:hypothetical protein